MPRSLREGARRRRLRAWEHRASPSLDGAAHDEIGHLLDHISPSVGLGLGGLGAHGDHIVRGPDRELVLFPDVPILLDVAERDLGDEEDLVLGGNFLGGVRVYATPVSEDGAAKDRIGVPLPLEPEALVRPPNPVLVRPLPKEPVEPVRLPNPELLRPVPNDPVERTP